MGEVAGNSKLDDMDAQKRHPGEQALQTKEN